MGTDINAGSRAQVVIRQLREDGVRPLDGKDIKDRVVKGLLHATEFERSEHAITLGEAGADVTRDLEVECNRIFVLSALEPAVIEPVGEARDLEVIDRVDRAAIGRGRVAGTRQWAGEDKP